MFYILQSENFCIISFFVTDGWHRSFAKVTLLYNGIHLSGCLSEKTFLSFFCSKNLSSAVLETISENFGKIPAIASALGLQVFHIQMTSQSFSIFFHHFVQDEISSRPSIHSLSIKGTMAWHASLSVRLCHVSPWKPHFIVTKVLVGFLKKSSANSGITSIDQELVSKKPLHLSFF
jgi:hypothetical protein